MESATDSCIAYEWRGSQKHSATKGASYWTLGEQYYHQEILDWHRAGEQLAESHDWFTVNLPPMQDLLFAPCYVRSTESLWTAGKRLNKPFGGLSVSNAVLLPRPKGKTRFTHWNICIPGRSDTCNP